jgi:hypothetical protein
MFKRIFQSRSAERKEAVRSGADLVRDRRNVGLSNDPVPDYDQRPFLVKTAHTLIGVFRNLGLIARNAILRLTHTS